MGEAKRRKQKDPKFGESNLDTIPAYNDILDFLSGEPCILTEKARQEIAKTICLKIKRKNCAFIDAFEEEVKVSFLDLPNPCPIPKYNLLLGAGLKVIIFAFIIDGKKKERVSGLRPTLFTPTNS